MFPSDRQCFYTENKTVDVGKSLQIYNTGIAWGLCMGSVSRWEIFSVWLCWTSAREIRPARPSWRIALVAWVIRRTWVGWTRTGSWISTGRRPRASRVWWGPLRSGITRIRCRRTRTRISCWSLWAWITSSVSRVWWAAAGRVWCRRSRAAGVVRMRTLRTWVSWVVGWSSRSRTARIVRRGPLRSRAWVRRPLSTVSRIWSILIVFVEPR